MKNLVALLILASILSGCGTTGPVTTYTFKKERVDQDLEGNRGYLLGTPPPAPARAETPKRTLIGVDVELPPYEKEEVVAEEEIAAKEEPRYEKKTVEAVPTKKPVRIKGEAVEEEVKTPVQIKGEAVEEEEWIK